MTDPAPLQCHTPTDTYTQREVLGHCAECDKLTHWTSKLFSTYVCSAICGAELERRYAAHKGENHGR